MKMHAGKDASKQLKTNMKLTKDNQNT